MFPHHFQVKDLQSGIPLLHGKTRSDLYKWPASSTTISSFFANTKPKTTLEDWHHRLGHPSSTILNRVISVFSLPVSKFVSQTILCPDSSINKTHKLPFSQHNVVSTHPLKYIFSDVWTSPQMSIDNSNITSYSWIITHDMSCFTLSKPKVNSRKPSFYSKHWWRTSSKKKLEPYIRTTKGST